MTDTYEKMEWLTGWPEKRGLYFCRIDDGPQVILHHHHCDGNGRSWWTDTSGYDVTGHVEYKLPPIIKQNA